MKISAKIRATLIAGTLLIIVGSCAKNDSSKGETQEAATGYESVDEYNKRKRAEAQDRIEKEKNQAAATSQSSTFLKKYAGAYTIEVRGYSSSTDAEALALGPDGQCTWIWLRKTASGAMATQKKYGHWTAREGFIHTVIRGQTGDIPEDYTLVNGVFRNGDRYLKKTGN